MVGARNFSAFCCLKPFFFPVAPNLISMIQFILCFGFSLNSIIIWVIPGKACPSSTMGNQNHSQV